MSPKRGNLHHFRTFSEIANTVRKHGEIIRNGRYQRRSVIHPRNLQIALIERIMYGVSRELTKHPAVSKKIRAGRVRRLRDRLKENPNLIFDTNFRVARTKSNIRQLHDLVIGQLGQEAGGIFFREMNMKIEFMLRKIEEEVSRRSQNR